MTNEQGNKLISNSVLVEKVTRLEAEVIELRKGMNKNSGRIYDLESEQKLVIHKLDEIKEDVSGISAVVTKDTGWRGFFIDVIKAAAQIAALIGAGTFIF